MGSSVMYWAVDFLFTSDRMKRKMAPPGSCLLPYLSPSRPGDCLLSRSQLIPWHLGRCTAWGEGSGAVEIMPGALCWPPSAGCWPGMKGRKTAAANMVRESLGNPTMFSFTKIPGKINSQQAPPFSYGGFFSSSAVAIWTLRAESVKALPHATAHQDGSQWQAGSWRGVLSWRMTS